jgi:RNA polymerase subunit RPABC4/transcription elongation factor Spt4
MIISFTAFMDQPPKTGFQAFRETSTSKIVGIALALLVSSLLVSMGFVGSLDGLIVVVLAYFFLRFFRVRDIRLLLLTAVVMLIIFTVIIYNLINSGAVTFSKPDPSIVEILPTVAFTFILPFLVLVVLTWWLRKNLERTRARLEAEGRLYPQGYGRCKRCGALVLPGEVMCRKCGEYIDVPEEMRVKKVNYFECSECGREVDKDAGVCPFCGEAFEDDAKAEEPKQLTE